MLSGEHQCTIAIWIMGAIMRSTYSGRRFSCLEVLLALFLSAPISLSRANWILAADAAGTIGGPSARRNRKHRVRLLAPTFLPL